LLSGASIGLAALLSQKNLAESQGGLSSAIERLSSGLKINRAKDDATRSKVSLEITQQTRTLAAAALNAENAISMAATADSALSGIGDLLLRIKELAVKGRDQALSATQLKSVTDEMEQMRRQINSISNQSVFNGRRLLTDELGSWVTVIPDETLDLDWDGEYAAGDSVKVVITANGSDLVRLFGGDSATAGSSSLSLVTGYETSKSSWASGQTDIAFTGTWADAQSALRDLELQRQTGNGIVDVQVIPQDMNVLTINGVTSYYKVVSTQVDWTTARSGALSSTFRGLSGYLANITSQTENDFLRDKTAVDAWIGGSDSVTEGTWQWMDGPEEGQTFWIGTGGGSVQNGLFANWNSGEPNQAGNEDYAQFYSSSGLTKGKWNDLDGQSNNAVTSYVIEYGGTSSAAAIAGKQFAIDSAPTAQEGELRFQIGATTRDTYIANEFRDARVAANNRDDTAGDTYRDLATSILNVYDSTESATSTNFARIANLTDDVIADVGYRRTALGTMQNRLAAAMGNMFEQSQGLKRSNSGFIETDFAAETARLTKMQIGQQAAAAAVAQANLVPNLILSLLSAE